MSLAQEVEEYRLNLNTLSHQRLAEVAMIWFQVLITTHEMTGPLTRLDV